MQFSIQSGVFPTMITPYTQEGKLDFRGIAALVDYYARAGCAGIFALCHSSEIEYLSPREKREMLRAVVEANQGRMQIVASGNTSYEPAQQADELGANIECGADAAVIITNRMAGQDESDDVVIQNIGRVMADLPGVPLGLYECPSPYKRLLSGEVLRWAAQTGRVVFIKDTCCDLATLVERQRIVDNSPLRIYNANTATLLPSLRAGVYGYSGIMANFHADLYVELFKRFRAGDPIAEELQSFLSICALIEYQYYPVNARYRRILSGTPLTLVSRVKPLSGWNPTFAAEVEAMYRLEERWRERLGLPDEG